MAPGRKTLRRVQWAVEVTPGTPVTTSTALWRGTSSGIEDARTIEEIEEQIGKLGGTNRSAVTLFGSTLELEETPATFEQLQYLLAMAFGGPVTGSADGVGSDFIYTTNIPENSGPTLVTYTVKSGDDAEALKFDYAHCPEFKLTFAAGETVKVSATLRGQETSTATFTAVTASAVTELLGSLGKVYIDAIGGTYGSTQVANQILAGEIVFSPVHVEKPTLDGSLDWSFVIYTSHKITGRLTFEHDTAAILATSGGLHDAFKTQTAKKLQIKFESAATVTNPGTTYSKKTVIVNLPIKWNKVSVLSDIEGNDTVDGEFTSNYDLTADDSGQVIVVNELSALP